MKLEPVLNALRLPLLGKELVEQGARLFDELVAHPSFHEGSILEKSLPGHQPAFIRNR